MKFVELTPSRSGATHCDAKVYAQQIGRESYYRIIIAHRGRSRLDQLGVPLAHELRVQLFHDPTSGILAVRPSEHGRYKLRTHADRVVLHAKELGRAFPAGSSLEIVPLEGFAFGLRNVDA